MDESKNIDITVNKEKVGELFFNSLDSSYGFNYTSNIAPISLIMPYRKNTYFRKNRLHPIFEMNMPEGFLYELFKNRLSKEHGYINDFLVLTYLGPNIDGRIGYKSSLNRSEINGVDIEDVIHNDTKDTFSMLLNTFLKLNAISGVQPKTLALLNNKTSFTTKEYIVKTWGEEFPNLAENEYFCLKAVEKTGVKIPNIILSYNKNFLLVERFNYDFKNNTFLGFEEILGLLGKNSDGKYSGSYEQVAKVVYSVTTNKNSSMRDLFKIIVMNYLLKNGDAHLKNFGIIYNTDFTVIDLAPAYDIVNTTAYIFKDRPALTLFGNKLWSGKKDLIKFAIQSCYLTKNDADKIYNNCLHILKETVTEIEEYIKNNPTFETIGNRMIDSFKTSLTLETIKEMPDEIIRNW